MSPRGEYPVQPGLTIGHGAVGTIHELGAGVVGYHLGQRVLVGTITPCGQCRFCLEALGIQATFENALRVLAPVGLYQAWASIPATSQCRWRVFTRGLPIRRLLQRYVPEEKNGCGGLCSLCAPSG